MKLLRNLLAITTLLVAGSMTAGAQLSVASVFTDNMVLQRSSLAPIWGHAAPNTKVTATGSWDTKSPVITISDKDGFWIMSIRTPKAGGPYTVSITTDTTVTLDNVLIGEVWLCSGQSNMEWTPRQNLKNAEAEIAAADHPSIRIFQTPRVHSATAQTSTKGEWAVCTPETMARTSSVAYFFARRLTEEMGVPVGIIVSAWGGSPIESWIPTNKTPINPRLEGRLVRQEWTGPDGAMYNQMIHPFTPMKLAGAIWYQGESNQGTASVYGALLRDMIRRWRDVFATEFPFYLVQIAPYNYNSDTEGPARVREQQEIVSKIIPRTGMVVVSDLVDDVSDIHPSNKQDVGLRLANMALSGTYQRDIKGCKSPTFRSMKVKRDKARIKFFDASPVLRVEGSAVNGLLIAGESGEFFPAQGRITPKNRLEVWSDKVPRPLTVRYCFDDSTIGNIFSQYGLPVAPFRSNVSLVTE